VSKKSSIKRHAVDRRAGRLADEIEGRGEPDDIFNTVSAANVTDLSEEFFEQGRIRGYGPEFVKFGSLVGYRRDSVVRWLRERARVYATSRPEAKRQAFAGRMVCR
jgi:hypothetical protein